MKKFLSSLALVLSVLILSGCSLAKTDDTVGLKSDTSNYIPARIEFSLYKDNFNNQIDVSEYFYVNLACPDMTVFDNCTSSDFGPSIDSHGTHIHTQASTVNGEEQPTVNTTTIELTLYGLKETGLDIRYTIILENIDGDIKEMPSHSTNFASGLTLSGEVEGSKEDGSKHILNYTLHFEALDVLKTIHIKQFNEADQLLKDTLILQEDELDELVLEDDTAYYFIIESYEAVDGTPYQERSYHKASEDMYYLIKYANTDGFLNGDRVFIHQND